MVSRIHSERSVSQVSIMCQKGWFILPISRGTKMMSLPRLHWLDYKWMCMLLVLWDYLLLEGSCLHGAVKQKRLLQPSVPSNLVGGLRLYAYPGYWVRIGKFMDFWLYTEAEVHLLCGVISRPACWEPELHNWWFVAFLCVLWRRGWKMLYAVPRARLPIIIMVSHNVSSTLQADW